MMRRPLLRTTAVTCVCMFSTLLAWQYPTTSAAAARRIIVPHTGSSPLRTLTLGERRSSVILHQIRGGQDTVEADSEDEDAYDEYYDVEEDMSEDERENDVRLSRNSERNLEVDESDVFAASYDDRSSEAITAVGDQDADDVVASGESSLVDLQLLEESEEVFVDIMTNNNDHDELDDDNASMEDPVETVNANANAGGGVDAANYELFESDNEEELAMEGVGDTGEVQSMEDLTIPLSIDGEVHEDEGEVSEEERTVMEKEDEEEEDDDLVFSETAMENHTMEAEEEDEEDEMLMMQAPPRMEDEDSAAFVDKMELADAYDDGETTAGGGGMVSTTEVVDSTRLHEEEMINMEEASSLIEEAVAVADEVQQEQAAAAAAAAEEKASLATSSSSTYGSIQEDSPSSSVQYMITLNMRRVLVDELGYLPREVKHMRPDVAAVVVDKMLKRPSSGMPTPWYVDESKAVNKSDQRRVAIKRVLKQIVLPAFVAGATIAFGARAWGTLHDDVPLMSTITQQQQQPLQYQPSNGNNNNNPASSIVVKSMSYAAPEPGDPNYPKAYDKPIQHSVAPTFGLEEEDTEMEAEEHVGSPIRTTPTLTDEEYEREADEQEEEDSRRVSDGLDVKRKDGLDVKRKFPYQKDLDETWLDRVISSSLETLDGVFRKTI